MYARGITRFEVADESVLDDSPAAVHRKTGVCYINPALIRRLGMTKAMLVFMLLHENAHLVLNTDDELAVDAYAHRQYMDLGYSLKQSVYAHTKVLSFDKTEDFVRARLQLERALAYDHEHNR
ncbi:MAG TPA: hypothetical protein PJ995_21570 [Cyclobacteriaceae bacterium]|nr:hypothetical protein [Cyclobacteriaceae bacterium]HMX02941.1 hypothetical protein [Cyclobacteriaceae bacterium]